MKRLIAVSLIAVGSAAFSADNLILNPGFDADLAPWTVRSSSSVAAQWSVVDASGSPSSGSALLTNYVSSGRWVLRSTCIPVDPAGSYAFGAVFLVVAGQTTTGGGYTTVGWYSDPGCSTNLLFDRSPTVGTPGTWVATSVEVAANGAQSADLFLGVVKNEDFDSLDVHSDDVWLIRTDIFTDGFESGVFGDWVVFP